MTKPIGIDLGTTNSVAAVAADVGVDIVVADTGERTIPSVVAVPSPDETSSVLVGRPAENQTVQNPEGTIKSVKRQMGESDPVSLHGETYTPEEVSALILKKVVADAVAYLGHEVSEAVIIVPAYFTDQQRAATITAAELAGISVIQLLNEPTAACLAHGYDRDVDDELVLVYDLGGGTFDVSLVDIGMGVYEVVVTDGDSQLGGDDWDKRIVEWITTRINEEWGGHDVRSDPRAMARIRDHAVEAKHTLSAREEARIVLPYIAPEYNFEATLSRETFEEATADLLEQTLDIVEQTLDEYDVDPAAVDTLLLVGGATRMPQVETALEQRFGMTASRETHPDEAVASGAAQRAAQRTGDNNDDILLVDVVSQSLGIQLANDRFDVLIEANSSTPTSARKDDYTVSHLGPERARIRIYQGEDETASNNELLGEFVVEDVDKGAATLPQFAIRFDVDESGILTVEAEDMERSTSESIQVRSVATETTETDRPSSDDLPTIR